MGLDIYLKRFEDLAEAQRLEGLYSKASEEFWNFGERGYDDITTDEKEQARAKCTTYALSIGLNEDGEYRHKQYIEATSNKYPDHYFKVGYFQSSCNETGINRVLGNALGISLYDIFDYKNDLYYFKPDWMAVKTRVQDAITKFRDYIEKSPYKVMKASFNPFLGIPDCDSERKAIEIYIEESNKYSDRQDWTAWRNSKGDFWVNDSISVRAVIPGTTKRLASEDREPCFYLVYEDKELNWYLQALEIIEETCDWVIAQPDIDKYVLAWNS